MLPVEMKESTERQTAVQHYAVMSAAPACVSQRSFLVLVGVVSPTKTAISTPHCEAGTPLVGWRREETHKIVPMAQQ